MKKVAEYATGWSASILMQAATNPTVVATSHYSKKRTINKGRATKSG